MALSIDTVGRHSFGTVRNAVIAVFIQVLSSLLSIIGVVQMRKAYSAAGVTISNGQVVPWETGFVVIYCFAVTAVDISALYFVSSDWKGMCGGSGLALLHVFLWFCVVFFGVAVLAVGIGYVVMGLASTGLLQESDASIFYGMSSNAILALNDQIDLYMTGAWTLMAGAFLSVPPQGWLISATANECQAQAARDTEYKPGGSPRWAKQTPDRVAYYNSKGKSVSIKMGESDPLFQNNAYQYESF